ncbi:MAG: membrane integrity-associated transporter subunit PqiC, partial [Myxococcales bacterium]
MAIRLGSWAGAALVAALLGGCGTTAPSRFYTLASTASPGGASALGTGVMVGPVSVPASVDRPEFVVQVAPNRVEVDEFNRWAAPLGEAIARTVASDLAALLGTPDVATAPFANFDPVYRVTINVQRFDSVQGEAALLEAVWTVREVAGGKTRQGRTVAREALEGPDFDALPAAHSRALAKLSGEIAAAI